MRPLQRLGDEALADLGHHGAARRDRPVFALDVVGRVAAPDREHLVDRLDEHGVAVGVEIAEQFRVGEQPARADAEDQPAIEHVIEHRDRGGNGRRMRVRHVDRAGTETDLLLSQPRSRR